MEYSYIRDRGREQCNSDFTAVASRLNGRMLLQCQSIGYQLIGASLWKGQRKRRCDIGPYFTVYTFFPVLTVLALCSVYTTKVARRALVVHSTNARRAHVERTTSCGIADIHKTGLTRSRKVQWRI